ncbi:STAS domain-containing protein [Streptomyces sp. NPDC088785]|uniref:STAS domain-containing protein n=1 Tax=Streptomyces sp. NPDC088785 TaxID=3365897 RepID=UPI00382C5730
MNGLILHVDAPEGRRVLVHAKGELDLHASVDLYTQVQDLLATSPTVIMDMSAVTFCDSSGFNALLRLHRRAQESGGRLVLAAPHPTVSRLLALTGSDQVFEIFRTRAEACEAHPTGI